MTTGIGDSVELRRRCSRQPDVTSANQGLDPVTVHPTPAWFDKAQSVVGLRGLGQRPDRRRRVASRQRAETQRLQGIHLGPAVMNLASPSQGLHGQRFAIATNDGRDQTANQQHGCVVEPDLVGQFGGLSIADERPVKPTEAELEPSQDAEDVRSHSPVALGLGACQARFDERNRLSVPAGVPQEHGAMGRRALHHRHRHESLELHRAVE
ncbi:MAG: hypothetical protein L0Y54_17200 [Sporichthyaceae bacterium]|nr:hypothetical protein [Sporichthyaceae bacterium]